MPIQSFLGFYKSRSNGDISEPFVIKEINALIRYASEKGIDPQGNTLSRLSGAITDYELVKNKNKNEFEHEKKEHAGKILTMYAQLTIQTFPVNGRSLIDTSFHIWTRVKLVLLTFILLVLALGNEIILRWFPNGSELGEGWVYFLINIQQNVLDLISPFLWGGIGSCVYLLKKVSDFAQDRQFENAKLHGWALRVLLGGILAAIVLYLFDLNALPGTGEALDANAVAFLVGLGVKVVYGAFERLIELLANKMDLGAIQRDKFKSPAVRKFLNKKIEEAETDIDKQATLPVLKEILKDFEK